MAEAETSGGGGGGGGSSGGSSSSSTSDSGDEENDPEEESTVTSSGTAKVTLDTSGESTKVTVTGTSAGDTVSVENSQARVNSDVERAGSGVEQLDVTFSGETDFDMDIATSESNPDPTSASPPRSTVSYINVVHTANDNAVSNVDFTFQVNPTRLENAGLDEDEVALYRYNGGEWNELETEYIGTADGKARFSASSPGLSVFAIAAQSSEDTTEETTEDPVLTDDEDETATDTESTEAGGPGFGVTAALMAFVLVGFFLRRRL